MKKVVSLTLSTLLVLSLAACGKADSSAAASSESKSSASSSSASSNSTSNSTQDYSPDGIKVGETYTTVERHRQRFTYAVPRTQNYIR